MNTAAIDATPSGVSDPLNPAADPVERPKSRRDEAMAAINAANMGRLADEMGVPVESLTGGPAGPDDEPAAPDDTDAQLAAQLDEGKVIDQVEGLKVKIKVDGEESDVLLSDILRNYQKGSAADKRLEEATRLLRDAEARAALPAPAPAVQAAPAQAEQASDEMVGRAKQALSKLYEGDEDAAAQLLAQMMTPVQGAPAATPAAPLDLDELTGALEARLEVKSAFATIKSDYPDVLSDPDLDTLTVTKAKAKEAGGMPRAEAMLEAAKDVYKLLNRKPAGRPSTDPKPTTRDEKLARKAELDSLETANASSTAATAQEDASPSAVIAAMAAQRLGQSMPRG